MRIAITPTCTPLGRRCPWVVARRAPPRASTTCARPAHPLTAALRPGGGVSWRSIMSNDAILITGAASGVGRATAAMFLARGYHVIITDVDAPALSAAFPEGASTRTIVADLAERGEVEALVANVKRVLQAEGWGLRGVALVAGISWAAPSLLADEELVRQTMQVNALAPYTLIRGLFADLERAPKGGRIVVVSSLAGCIPQAWCCAYSMSKAAVESMCDCIRFELDAVGSSVSITSLLPALIDTPLLDRRLAGEASRWSSSAFFPAMQRFVDGIARMRPSRHTLTPELVAARIVDVLTASRRARAREVVVRSGALAVRLIAVLPDPWRDWFRRQAIDRA